MWIFFSTKLLKCNNSEFGAINVTLTLHITDMFPLLT